MTELRRWCEEGATAAELSLLETSRREQVPPRVRAGAMETLGLLAAASTVATATTAAAATGRGTAVLLKLLSIPVIGGGLVAGGLALEHARHARAIAPRQAAVVASASSTAAAHAPSDPSARVDLTVAPASAPSAAASTLPAPTTSVGVRSARTEGSAGRLAREVQALELAQKALAAHNAGSALHLLDRYGAEFQGGALGSEATVLRVQALLMNGNRSAAQALADSYSSAHPDSPYAHRIQDTLRSGH